MSDPRLPEHRRAQLVTMLMDARREKGRALRIEDAAAVARARQSIDAAKHALGERGAVWWSDGAPDYSRRMAGNTPYAEWYAALPER